MQSIKKKYLSPKLEELREVTETAQMIDMSKFKNEEKKQEEKILQVKQ